MKIVYTLSEACEMLQISESTVRRKIREGKIPKEKWCGKILIPGWFFENIKNGEQAIEQDLEN